MLIRYSYMLIRYRVLVLQKRVVLSYHCVSAQPYTDIMDFIQMRLALVVPLALSQHNNRGMILSNPEESVSVYGRRQGR